MLQTYLLNYNIKDDLSYLMNIDNINIEFEEQLIPTIKSFELKMYSSKKEWNSIISYLYQDHKDLLLCVL